jgi:nucleotide-binding universal stress UspA family protein
MKPQISSLPLNILLAVDGSEHSLAAAKLIRDMPLPTGSDVTVLGVLTLRRTIGRAPLQTAVEEACTIILSNNVGVKTGLLHGHPAEQLTEFANQHRPDLMVVGAKGLRATLGILLEGVAQQVVEHARWPVLVVRSPYEGLRRVLLVTDGSLSSQRATDYIAQSPLPRNSQLHVMQVLPPLETPETYIPARMAGMSTIPPLSSRDVERAATRQAEAEEHHGQMLLTQTVDVLKAGQFEVVPVLRRGDAATEILEYAKAHEVNLIVTGSRGLSAVKAWLLGSVSRKLIYHCKCSVLVIPEQIDV